MGVMRTLTLNGVTYEVESSVPTATTVTLKAADWLGDTSPYSQVVAVDGATSRTKVDLQPTMDQVDMMYSQSVGFFTMNEGGVVRAYAVGSKPTENFTIQITMTEVESNSTRIKGNTVGFPNPQPDWNQTDPTQADFIKNKPFQTAADVLDQMSVTHIDFSNFANGSFEETVNGEVISHTVTFDEAGRPASIDGVTITWGDV